MPDTPPITEQVIIFYSSKNEPRLPDLYEEAIHYLQDTQVETEIVDVSEDASRAREFDVVSTPTVVVVEGEETHKHVGMVDGLERVMEHDLYGQSVMQEITFKKGRAFAVENGLQGEDDPDTIEAALQDRFGGENMDEIVLEEFDATEQVAEARFIPIDADRIDSQEHERLEALLGGIFTEIFGSGVMGAEIKCALDSGDVCVFHIEER